MYAMVVSPPLAVGGNAVVTYQIPSVVVSAEDTRGWVSARVPVKYSQVESVYWGDRLMYHVELYSKHNDLLGEFFVNKIVITRGAVTTQYGPMLDVANRIILTYTDEDTNSEATAITVNNTDSQAKYGIFERVIDGGTTNSTLATQAAYKALTDLGKPRKHSDDNGNPKGENRIEIELAGYEALLDTYYYSASSGSDVNLTTKLQSVLAAQPNSLFSTNYSNVTSNTSQVDPGQSRKTAREVINDLLNFGDSTQGNRYSFGIYESQTAYYRVITDSSTVTYLKRSDEFKITDLGGERVDPWLVRPGYWLEFSDVGGEAYLGQVTFTSPDKVTFSNPHSRNTISTIAHNLQLGKNTEQRLRTVERRAGTGDTGTGIFVKRAGDTMTGALKLDPTSGVTTGILVVDAPSSSTSNYTLRLTRAGADVFTVRDDGTIVNNENISYAAGKGPRSGSSAAQIVFPTGGGLSGNINIDSSTSNGTRKAIFFATPIGNGIRWSYDGVDGTARVVYDNGTDDVLYVVGGQYVVRDSAGTITAALVTATAPGGTFNLYDDGGTNTLQLIVNANGEISVQRTAGSLTYKVFLDLIWI